MKKVEPFKFSRGRGIVWVCDLSQSSSYLNDDEIADQIEEFIPRFYFISKLLVESYGGEFLKWNGDGFLAWFGFELDRNKKAIASNVFEAAFQLSLMCNVTQFGIQSKKKFKIRHGITYEQDALLMQLLNNGQRLSSDIIGRSVVLAFRLSGIATAFPSIITVKDLASFCRTPTKKWLPTAQERLKYFKDEKYSLNELYVSVDRKLKPQKLETLVKKAEATLNNVEKEETTFSELATVFVNKMSTGPAWTNKVLAEYFQYIRYDLFENLKQIIDQVKNEIAK